MSRVPPSLFLRVLAFLIAVLFLAPASRAQLAASPPVADPNDRRFEDVTEDWTSPALSRSHLRPVPALVMIDASHTEYTVQLIRLQWRWGDPLDVYLIMPTGVKKPAVILNLYGYPAGEEAYKNEVFQKALTKDGYAVVGFTSALTGHRYHDRPMKEWFLSELQESLATSAHDVQMLLNYLSARGDLDMSRVGMFGQGSGASIAILVSAVDPRIKVLDVLDPWGDWPTWMATSPFVPEEERAQYVKPEFLKKAAALEPMEWLPRIQAKKFRFQQNIFDRDTPKAVKEKLRASAPPGTRFVFYQTLSEFETAFPNSTNLEWTEHELRCPEEGTVGCSAPSTSASEPR